MTNHPIQITECPRDAMQGIKDFIPTQLKIEYLNLLLEVGFDTLDFGSFVSPKAIPQMQDTADVIKGLNLNNTSTRLLAIIANERGAKDACNFDEIQYLGFPLSVSETFQQRNTNASIAEAIQKIETIQNTCIQHHKDLVVYLSMGFGNPYGDTWSFDIVEHWALEIKKLGAKKILLADTVGSASTVLIEELFKKLQTHLNDIDFGIHLHASPLQYKEKIEAAYLSGCLHFDTAIMGFGGCPMAKDELVGNIATERLIDYFEHLNIDLNLNKDAFERALLFGENLFGKYH